MEINRQDPATILIIDGDPLTLTAMAAAMHLSGHESYSAQSSEAALKAARALTLDLIICDIDVENASGIELVHEIRQLPGLNDVPVIFISARPAQNIVQRAHDAGGNYYLRKPFDPEVLLELVDKSLWMPHLVNTQIRRSTGSPAT
jgi:DNA-binding response OmpR family regulator